MRSPIEGLKVGSDLEAYTLLPVLLKSIADTFGQMGVGRGCGSPVGREQALCFLLGVECAGWFDSLES